MVGDANSGKFRWSHEKTELPDIRGRCLPRAAPNANGAGIAADPTLTCAWSLRFLRSGRQAVLLACPVRALGDRCLARVQLRLPMSALSGLYHPSPLCFAGLSPALAPASDFASPCLPLLQDRRGSPFASACRSAQPRPKFHSDKSNTGRSLPEGSFLQLSSASITALNDCIASHLSQTIKLALSRNLMHVFSQELRGQQQPCPWSKKSFLKSVPCGSSFESFFVPKTS